VKFQRVDKEIQTAQFTKSDQPLTLGESLGLYSSELFVDKAVPKSPAEAAGVKSGDRLIGVGDKKVQSFFELKDAVQKSGEKEGKVVLNWERAGKAFSTSITPTATAGRDPVLNKTTQYTVGVMPMLTLAEPDTYVERIWNPFKLVSVATQKMITFSWRNLVSLRKMVTGEVSMGSIGGPLMIGKIAGESLARGLIVFLTNMAIFSIGLGVLNVLPVPVLDGGHLLLLGVEILRGKPLSLKQMEIVQGFGLVLILALMGIAFHNDIARLFYS
jgi:regulator of sigma E protease